MSSPTRYTVIYFDIQASPHLTESLTYKLCFTDCNLADAIKEPFVIYYAHRLVALVGEFGGHELPTVHLGFKQKDPSIYFI